MEPTPGGEISAGGKVLKSLPSSFSRFPNIMKKFGKHSDEWSQWGTISKQAFYNRAINLADNQIGRNIYGFTSKQGWMFQFNSKTGEFLTIHPKGYLETFFRPSQGMDYYLKQVQLYGK